jgi:hypothetical protein
MMRKVVFIFVGLLAFGCVVNAQMLKPVPISYLNENNRQNCFVQPLMPDKAAVISGDKRFSIANNLKCTLPKGAIFCRMEDAIYNHLNFCVKFRMGTDDRYSN